MEETKTSTCFCGNPIAPTEDKEISPSMYYVPRRTCSTLCHNLWILGRFEDSTRPVGDGWSKIIDDLYDDIYEIDPDCEIVQVKEKFGTLRFYANYTEPDLPLEITKEEVWSLMSAKSDLYYELQRIDAPDDWFGEDDVRRDPLPDWKVNKMRSDYENIKSLVDKLRPIEALIAKAEDESAKTCEECGEPGTLDKDHYWLLTLCGGCKSKRAEGKKL